MHDPARPGEILTELVIKPLALTTLPTRFREEPKKQK